MYKRRDVATERRNEVALSVGRGPGRERPADSATYGPRPKQSEPARAIKRFNDFH